MLTDLVKDKVIILGSQSPRRKELLSGILDDFKTEVRSVDEVYPDGLTNGEIADYLSKLKARVFQSNLKENEIVITADTIVLLEISTFSFSNSPWIKAEGMTNIKTSA